MVQAKGLPMVSRLRLDPLPGRPVPRMAVTRGQFLARSGGEQVVASGKDYHCFLTLCDISFRLMFLLCRHAGDLFAHRASR